MTANTAIMGMDIAAQLKSHFLASLPSQVVGKIFCKSPKIFSKSSKIFTELRLAERSERAGCGGGAGGRGAAQHAAGGRQDQGADRLGGHQVSGHKNIFDKPAFIISHKVNMCCLVLYYPCLR